MNARRWLEENAPVASITSIFCHSCRSANDLVFNAPEECNTPAEQSCLTIRSTNLRMSIVFRCKHCQFETELPRFIDAVR